MDIELQLTPEHRRRVQQIANRLGVELPPKFMAEFVSQIEMVVVLAAIENEKLFPSEFRDALATAENAVANARHALGELGMKAPRSEDGRLDAGVGRAVQRHLSIVEYDSYQATLRLCWVLNDVEASIRQLGAEFSVPKGGRRPSHLAAELGRGLAGLYEWFFDRTPGVPGGDGATPFSDLVDIAIDVLGDRYSGPSARTVARIGRAHSQSLTDKIEQDLKQFGLSSDATLDEIQMALDQAEIAKHSFYAPTGWEWVTVFIPPDDPY